MKNSSNVSRYVTQTMDRVEVKIRQVIGLSSHMPTLRLGFVVDKVTQAQVALRLFRFSLVSIIPPMLHTPSFV